MSETEKFPVRTLRDVLDETLPDSVLPEERDYIEESILAAGYRQAAK